MEAGPVTDKAGNVGVVGHGSCFRVDETLKALAPFCMYPARTRANSITDTLAEMLSCP